MKYKAIIFDLDGTAIPMEALGRPSAQMVKAVKDNQDKIILTAATGRSITDAGYLLDELELKYPCVISGGTEIVDPTTKKVIWNMVIDPKDVQAVLDVMNHSDQHIIYNDERDEEGKPASERDNKSRVNVIYMIGLDREEAAGLAVKFNEIENITATTMGSWEKGKLDIHITHKEATKEHAIEELLKILGVRKQEVIGVGDGGNDVHLFAGVGYKVAMGNATEELKDIANEVIASVEQDGLADLIDRVVNE